MAAGKPYRYGLMAAGLCVACLGLFVMTRERPHVYGTLCALGVLMVCVGTVWSMCQCYPRVVLVSHEEEGLEDNLNVSTEAKSRSNDDDEHDEHDEDGLLHGCHGERGGGGGGLVPEVARRHSCPVLNLM